MTATTKRIATVLTTASILTFSGPSVNPLNIGTQLFPVAQATSSPPNDFNGSQGADSKPIAVTSTVIELASKPGDNFPPPEGPNPKSTPEPSGVMGSVAVGLLFGVSLLHKRYKAKASLKTHKGNLPQKNS